MDLHKALEYFNKGRLFENVEMIIKDASGKKEKYKFSYEVMRSKVTKVDIDIYDFQTATDELQYAKAITEIAPGYDGELRKNPDEITSMDVEQFFTKELRPLIAAIVLNRGTDKPPPRRAFSPKILWRP